MKRCSIRKADNGKLTSSGGTIAQETRSISITWESYAIIKNHQSLDFCCDTFNRIQVVEYMNDINHILYIIEWYWMLAYKMTSGLLGFRYASQILVTHVFQTFNLRLPRNRKKDDQKDQIPKQENITRGPHSTMRSLLSVTTLCKKHICWARNMVWIIQWIHPSSRIDTTKNIHGFNSHSKPPNGRVS